MASILVLDNSVVDRIKIVNALEPAGHKLAETSSGEEGLKFALDESPDLIIMDLVLVGLDGFKVIRKLREQSLQMPIIVQSAMGNPSMEQQARAIGATAFLRKPVNVSKLVDTVAQLLGQPKAAGDKG